MKRFFVPFNGNEDRLQSMGIGFDTLTELDTLGVLKFESLAGYITKGIEHKRILICVGDNLDVIEKHKNNEIPIGNVMLTSVGAALQAITESVEIEDYHDMIRNYLTNNSVTLANEHDFVLRTEGDSIVIDRKDSQ